MQEKCRVAKDNVKRCIYSKYEALLLAAENPPVTNVYKCPRCHAWHLTSKGGYRLPHWVRERQYAVIFSEPLKAVKQKELKKKKKREEKILPLSKQKELYAQLNNNPKRPWWQKLITYISSYGSRIFS